MGVLLANLGTPDAPTPGALRRYLRQFLTDPRVVEAPRLLWRPLLELVVLPLRAPRSARLYRAIWTAEGSPLLVTGRRQAAGLAERLERLAGRAVPVELGMRYGEPSLGAGLRRLAATGCRRILVLPLYPQYSATTTASVLDAVGAELARWRDVPEVRWIRSYPTDPGYVSALAASLTEHWDRYGRGERLLLSFHGIPRRYAEAGDPYPAECRATAAALAARLGLAESEITVAFQSRFGREPWVEPYTEDLLQRWGSEGIGSVDVVAPGFAADCLETLEELALRGARTFHEAGGGCLRYVPALGDREDHLKALAALAGSHLRGWLAMEPSRLS